VRRELQLDETSGNGKTIHVIRVGWLVDAGVIYIRSRVRRGASREIAPQDPTAARVVPARSSKPASFPNPGTTFMGPRLVIRLVPRPRPLFFFD